ncbi:MAG: DUF3450 domain-containing protein [Planctomycetes bacterium]|nr:DUF3450 domain-containing protein [Planctomycetota bacterium]
MQTHSTDPRIDRTPERPKRRGPTLALASALLVVTLAANSVRQGGDETKPTGAATLEETRLVMGKWIETQRLVSKERNDWQQGREILTSRLELVKQEIAGLETKIAQARTAVTETNAKRDALLAEDATLQSAGNQLTVAVTSMEDQVRRLFKSLPEPIQTKLQPLHQRIPEDPAKTRATTAERFQNVIGILNELNKANNELNVSYEVRNLANGKPSEVRAMYVGLAQAYYVSAGGEAGVGHPTPEGWQWEPSKTLANDVSMALEIAQGKQTPAFVPLPMKLQ